MLQLIQYTVFLFIVLTLIHNIYSFNFRMLESLVINSSFLRLYLYLTTFLHEFCHYIVSKLFGLKVTSFQVLGISEIKESSNNNDLNRLGAVDFEINGSFISQIACFFVGIAPFMFSFIIFLIPFNFTNYNTDTNIQDFLKELLGQTNLITIIFLTILFMLVLTNISTLSSTDINLMLNSHIFIVAYFILIFIFNLLLSGLSNFINQQDLIYLLLGSIIVFFISNLFNFNLISIIALVFTAMFASFFYKIILYFFIAFCLFYLFTLILSTILILILKGLMDRFYIKNN